MFCVIAHLIMYSGEMTKNMITTDKTSTLSRIISIPYKITRTKKTITFHLCTELEETLLFLFIHVSAVQC